jgi:hypothetical protein
MIRERKREREREREREEQSWVVTRFDWLEPLVPVSKNWFGRFESLNYESKLISGTGTRF